MTDIENTEEEIELTPAEDNPWYKFLLKSLELDEGDDGAYEAKPYGWHWFWGIYGLQGKVSIFPEFDIDEIEKKLPDNRCVRFKPYEQEEVLFQEMVFACEMQAEATDILHKLLQESDSLETIEEIDFSRLFFEHEVNFSNLIFPLPVSFEDSKFHNCVKFIKTDFCRRAEFSCTEFFRISNFDNANFFSSVSFGEAIFSSSSNFCNTIFFNGSEFYKTIFSKNANFTKAEFSRNPIFHKAEFHSGVIFLDVTFSKGAIFTNAIFSFQTIFDKVKITGHTDFKHAEFKDVPPSFHKVDMYSDIIWDEIKWPILNKESQRKIVKQNISTYEDLASYMKKLDKPQNEHIFYREYMRCRGWLEKQPMKSFYWLYEILADFGYGVGYALSWWFGHIFLGTVFIWAATKNVLCAFPVSFANAHGFLPFHKGPLKDCYRYFIGNDVFNTIWGFQTVIGIILLFLLLLTLRIRFRLK